MHSISFGKQVELVRPDSRCPAPTEASSRASRIARHRAADRSARPALAMVPACPGPCEGTMSGPAPDCSAVASTRSKFSPSARSVKTRSMSGCSALIGSAIWVTRKSCSASSGLSCWTHQSIVTSSCARAIAGVKSPPDLARPPAMRRGHGALETAAHQPTSAAADLHTHVVTHGSVLSLRQASPLRANVVASSEWHGHASNRHGAASRPFRKFVLNTAHMCVTIVAGSMVCDSVMVNPVELA